VARPRLDAVAVLGILLVSAGGILSIVLARPRHSGHSFWLTHGHGGQAGAAVELARR
jgi:hypothetical protein